MGRIDPPDVIAVRTALMLFFGVALPQVGGFLVNRAAATSWPTAARALGVIVPALTIAMVLLVCFQLDIAAQRASGTKVICATPWAAAFIMLLPGHAVIAAALQARLRYGSCERR
jgi:hypothetical protein